MELPDCPPGAEGYEDSVVEMPKKPSLDEGECTKAEQEFQDHLNSLKIKVENAGARCMVERRGRDVSGKWIYLCYPCAAVCSGESILQTHISGKKHKTKLSMKNVWPQSIFDEHPYVLSEKGVTKAKDKDAGGATEKVLQKMAEEVTFHNNEASDLDKKYNKYRSVRCHIQDALDGIKAPLVGLEYLVEHPPEQAHHEPMYMCTLCHKQGHPRTIINHLTCFWHRHNYLARHYTKATTMLAPYRSQNIYREGVTLIINRLAQRVEDKYGRLKPVNFDKEEYDKERDMIHQWICKSYHFSEKDGPSFEEVVDTDLIESLHKSNIDGKRFDRDKRDPSPPIVAAPTKPLFNNYTRPPGRQERRPSMDALSDISDEPDPRRRDLVHSSHTSNQRYEPYRRPESPPRHRYTQKAKTAAEKSLEKKPPNYEYKVKLATEQRQQAEDAARKTLAYHEKNPEKHPLYPEEWKKFWNRRYKEIQAEGKDPSKHDFKPEWILYWTARMKVLHQEELRVIVSEIYRKMCLPLPEEEEKKPDDARKSESRRSPDPRRRSPDLRRRSPDLRRRSPDPRRRSPDPRRRSPDPRRRSPDPRRRSPIPRRRSPELRRRSPVPRRRTPDRRRSPLADRYKIRKDDRGRRDGRSPGRYGDSRPEPSRPDQHRSRSPVHSRTRSPPRMHIEIESVRRSRSPLSRRNEAAPLRNRSPARASPPRDIAPSLQTVLISDDEFKADDGISPWNSDNEDSLGSLPEASTRASRAGSEMSRASRGRWDPKRVRPAAPADLGPPENVVATLRLLVALEDYLGSLGPKVVDLLTEALRMEKEKANSSEELLDRAAAVGLLETAKEKLKGAVQAGLVPAAAAPAVRAAVVRAAATLHAADTRAPAPQAQQASTQLSAGGAGVSVAGVGSVDRAQIAQQMAAALVAQGKTDVSSEELAQLVDAVVGMAEAKKREAEVKKKVEARAVSRTPRPAPAEPAQGKTASALQMLQSAYDENEKRIEKEDAPDAMDGLSDSDLETLLKNFNELSAEEQHSLIAYLKKLEAREPQRVEKLRQYVSADADAAGPAPPPAPAPPTVAIDSDDDDYTVEEVFQSATQKVKEDQIRQEMEIVKKSLEESTRAEPAPTAARQTSAASDLLALVHASLGAPEVVASRTQPRSFGDPPDAPPPPEPLRGPPSLLDSFLNNVSSTAGEGPWTARAPPPEPREPLIAEPPALVARGQFDADDRGQFNPDNRGQFNPDNRGQFNPDNRGQFNPDSRGQFNPDNKNMFNPDNRGQFNPDSRGQFNPDSRGQFNQDNWGQFNQDNRGPFGSDNRGQFTQDSRGPFNTNQDNMGLFNQDNMGGFNQSGRVPFNQDNRAPFSQDGRGQFNQDNRGPLLPDNSQGNRGFPMQNNRGPLIPDSSRPGFMSDNRSGPGFNNFGQDNMNRGNNYNNMNGRMQDMRPDQQQQYGNYDQQNFRGRGRGNFGGHGRGRGRGYY